MKFEFDNPVGIPLAIICLAGFVWSLLCAVRRQLESLEQRIEGQSSQSIIRILCEIGVAELTDRSLTLSFRVAQPAYWGIALFLLFFAGWGIEEKDLLLIVFGLTSFMVASLLIFSTRKRIHARCDLDLVSVDVLTIILGVTIRHRRLDDHALGFSIDKRGGKDEGGLYLQAEASRGRIDLLTQGLFWRPAPSEIILSNLAQTLNDWVAEKRSEGGKQAK